MAGIGFELRKVISRGGITSFFQVALSGSMLVAGPWILSILSISVMQRFLSSLFTDNPGFFMGVIVYSYAFSLILFGGLHYLFTRIISDFIFLKREREGSGMTFYCMLAIAVLAGVIGWAGTRLFPVEVTYPPMYIAGTILLFVSVNLIWILMIFITLLKWFIKILVVYGLGMGLSVVAVYWFGTVYSVSGAVLGFALGHLLIVVLLSVLIVQAYFPVFPSLKNVLFWAKNYLRNFFPLLLTGYCYYLGIWSDKIIFWFTLGDRVPHTSFYLFENFDILVYYTNLTMIPGLIFFVIWAETNFYTILRKFLVAMSKSRYPVIQKRKYILRRGLRQVLWDQIIFQGFLTLGLIILASRIPMFSRGELTQSSIQVLLAGVFFHLLYLTLLNYFFYLELYAQSVFLSLVFLAVNLSVAILTRYQSWIPPGASYCIAGIISSIIGWRIIFKAIKMLDRRILLRKDNSVLDSEQPLLPVTTAE